MTICKRCGTEFTSKNKRQLFCKQVKEATCPICGEKFSYICDLHIRETCSRKCQTQLINQRRTESLQNQTRICKWCGQEFHPKEPNDMYCDRKHFKKCIICGKEFEIDVRRDNSVNTCSKECKGKLMSQNHDYVKSSESMKKTLHDKYGVDNLMQIPGVVDKIKQSSIKKSS